MNRRGAPMTGRGVAIKRVLGIILMVFSGLGLGISLLAVVLVCRFSGPAAASADQALTLAVAALTSTQENLDLAQTALGEAQVVLGATQDFMDEAEEGLANTSALIGSLGEVLVHDLPDVIEQSQKSLSAAEQAAAVIEELLYGLNAISGLTGVRYDPEVSLTESFSGINESLDPIPKTLAGLDENLSAAQDNLDGIQTTVAELSGPLDETEGVLSEAQASVEAYSSTISQLTEEVRNLQGSLPNWTRAVVLAAYFLLIWLAVSQIGLLWQGWEMVSHHPRLLEDRVRELERKVETLAKRA
jgi:hypothetical protein